MKTQTQAILPPPPPLPPGRVAAGQADDAPQPSRGATSFWSEMWREVEAMSWPRAEIGAIGATIVVLGFFAASIAGVSALIGAALRALSL